MGREERIVCRGVLGDFGRGAVVPIDSDGEAVRGIRIADVDSEQRGRAFCDGEIAHDRAILLTRLTRVPRFDRDCIVRAGCEEASGPAFDSRRRRRRTLRPIQLQSPTVRASRAERVLPFLAPTTRPVSSLMGDTVSETSTRLPSFATRTVSKWSIRSPRFIFPRITGSSGCSSGGMMSVTDFPMISSAL